jgi:hypothetical protein
MKLARTIRFDESDENVFRRAAEASEWAISGAFAFSDFVEEDLKGKPRQEFRNGWLSLEDFGRATFVATAEIEQSEVDALTMKLAAHFMQDYGAPSIEDALPVAEAEIQHMLDLCDEHRANTLLVVERELTEAGVREAFRVIEVADAGVADVLGPMADHAIEMSQVPNLKD